MSRIRVRLEELGYHLPPPPTPAGSYRPVRRLGTLALTAGVLPFHEGRIFPLPGRLGAELDLQAGQEAARTALLNALAALEAELGDLDRIQTVVRLEGYVAATEHFSAHASVLNAASDLLVELWGEAGRHTRIAVGCSSLPLEAPIELVLWVEVAPA